MAHKLTLADQALQEPFFIDLIPEAGVKRTIQGYAEDRKDDENHGQSKIYPFPRSAHLHKTPSEPFLLSG
jgi:hypothetical protein